MFAFGMKMDEQALEPGTDEIRGETWNRSLYWGARHDRDLRFKDLSNNNLTGDIPVSGSFSLFTPITGYYRISYLNRIANSNHTLYVATMGATYWGYFWRGAIAAGVAAGSTFMFAALAIAFAYCRRRKPQDHFFHEPDRPEGQPALDWPIRQRIALGSARGLAYLHDYCDPKIIHRDVKAANILLDKEFEAVVGDFGLAKLMDYKDTYVTTPVCGTIGHMAPEHYSTGVSSEKIDVFGYGVMLLELITGQRAFDPQLASDDNLMLVDWVCIYVFLFVYVANLLLYARLLFPNNICISLVITF
ncbi:hypothetical protein C1H46_043805 [Malus baccata]|uniref:non-specific serine/threonine protein kinase n=1 Tax=Malus baccata TaxID=106549 RepID=A0A540K8W3_MALBA|nr:hypothetical protein C1H46_043805 [Malus baccata]